MSDLPILQGTFESVQLWETQKGHIFVEKRLAEFQCEEDGDTAWNSGGYPQGPTKAGLGYRCRETGQLFIIRPVRAMDEDAQRRLQAKLKRLQSYGG